MPVDRRVRWLTTAPFHEELPPIILLLTGELLSFAYFFGASFTDTIPIPLFPPQAVILSVLLLTPRRRWWLYLLIYYVIQVVQGAFSSLPLPYYLASNLANVVEPLIGAALFRTFVPRSPQQFASLRKVAIYVVCITLASVIGATWGAGVRAIVGFPFTQSWPGWFLSDVLASLVLAPTIVLWATSGTDGLQLTSRSRHLELALLCLVFAVTGVLLFVAGSHASSSALLYLMVPPLVWASVRFGPQGVMTALGIVTVMAVAGAFDGLPPFEEGASEANVRSLQLFLLGTGLPLFLLAALVLERQQALQRLAQSEERYRVMLGCLPQAAVAVFGPDLRHHLADGQALNGAGLSKAAIEGKTVAEAFPSQIAAELEPHYQSALAGQPTAFDLTHAGRHFEMNVVSIPDPAGPTGMLVMHDVTDQKRAEVLEELDRAKTAFFRNVSHDLRTPLALALGPVHDALPGGAISADMLQMVHRNLLRLQRMVNALLDFARLEAGRMHTAYALTDLSALTVDLASTFRTTIERAGLRLVIDAPPLPADLPVYVDRYMWEKVVLNLLSNAYNHTFDGQIGVSLHPLADGRSVELRVSDTGIGIPREEQARIFDPFHQVQGVRSREEGSGLGLAIVWELVQFLGGSVAVESEQEHGSTFCVRVPVGSAHIPPELLGDVGTTNGGDPTVDATWAWTPEAPEPESDDVASTHAGTLGRILAVDDNADMRRYIRHILGERWTVQTVSDGPGALRAVVQNPPELVLLDAMLPGMSGFEVLQALRDNPATRATPVIMVSARAGEEASVEGLLAGADDYIAKPFVAAELSARVATHIAAARARATAEAAVKQRDDFVTLVIHDLRHPLASLNWHIEAYRGRIARGQTPSTAQIEELLSAIEASGKWLSAQIDELHDATLLQGRPPLLLRPEPTDLVELARAVTEQRDASAGRCQLRFENTVAVLIGQWELARIQRVVANLLSNAVKYSPDGGDITVRVAQQGNDAVLSVEDHGLGIPEADLSRVFDPYARGSNVMSHIAGSGLGLAAAKGIVEQHRGTISVTSTEGKGSTFTVRLPLA